MTSETKIQKIQNELVEETCLNVHQMIRIKDRKLKVEAQRITNS